MLRSEHLLNKLENNNLQQSDEEVEFESMSSPSIKIDRGFSSIQQQVSQVEEIIFDDRDKEFDHKPLEKVVSLEQPQHDFIESTAQCIKKEEISSAESERILFIERLHSEVQEEYHANMIELLNIGFSDFDKNLRTLKECENDI